MRQTLNTYIFLKIFLLPITVQFRFRIYHFIPIHTLLCFPSNESFPEPEWRRICCLYFCILFFHSLWLTTFSFNLRHSGNGNVSKQRHNELRITDWTEQKGTKRTNDVKNDKEKDISIFKMNDNMDSWKTSSPRHTFHMPVSVASHHSVLTLCQFQNTMGWKFRKRKRYDCHLYGN